MVLEVPCISSFQAFHLVSNEGISYFFEPDISSVSGTRHCASNVLFAKFYLQLNASDDRGIDVVRGPVLSFASTRTIFK